MFLKFNSTNLLENHFTVRYTLRMTHCIISYPNIPNILYILLDNCLLHSCLLWNSLSLILMISVSHSNSEELRIVWHIRYANQFDWRSFGVNSKDLKLNLNWWVNATHPIVRKHIDWILIIYYKQPYKTLQHKWPTSRITHYTLISESLTL
jgi:hypothetical protein